jgi:hypothetical protein
MSGGAHGERARREEKGGGGGEDKGRGGRLCRGLGGTALHLWMSSFYGSATAFYFPLPFFFLIFGNLFQI